MNPDIDGFSPPLTRKPSMSLKLKENTFFNHMKVNQTGLHQNFQLKKNMKTCQFHDEYIINMVGNPFQRPFLHIS